MDVDVLDVREDIRRKFLQGMSLVASTVSVVTTNGSAGRYGLTVSSISSVTVDTKRPTLLACVNLSSHSVRALLDNAIFCVNVLRAEQVDVASGFARSAAIGDRDKFAEFEWTTQITGAPRLQNPLVAFDCSLVSTMTIGTHVVLFGEVEDIFNGSPGLPLIYANRDYATIRALP